MRLNLPSQLPIARYQFEFRVTEDIVLPEYSGSTLRGVWGHALRRIACMTKSFTCDGCAFIKACPYQLIFEAAVPVDNLFSKMQNIPQSYIVEPPSIGEKLYKKGEILQFQMILMGSIIDRISLVVSAWKNAFEKGICKDGGKAELVDVKVESQDRFISILNEQSVTPHFNKMILPTMQQSTITLEFETPVRLQKNGKAIPPDKIEASVLIMQLLRRLSLISTAHFKHHLYADYVTLKKEAGALKSDADLYWYDWVRYSNRQRQKMYLGGVLGRWTFYDLPVEFQMLLYLGQWIHVGKNTTFGLGKYRII